MNNSQSGNVGRFKNGSRQPPQSQPVNHWHNLVWWLVLIGSLAAIWYLPGFLESRRTVPPLAQSATLSKQNDAFISLVFGRVSLNNELAISGNRFQQQLEALKQASFSSIRVAQLPDWQRSDKATLPEKAVLLSFEDANRDTLETVDPILAAQGMTALVFVEVPKLNEGNIQLVSWHRLEELVKTGRWEVGISGCPSVTTESGNSFISLAKRLTEQRALLQERLKTQVIIADCAQAWNSPTDATAWDQALQAASLNTGFIATAPGANYRDGVATRLKRIRVAKTWEPGDLIANLGSHLPRSAEFVDEFDGAQPRPDWLLDRGELAVHQGALQFSTSDHESGALLTLAGTEKWQDAEAEVQLQTLPQGQFWLFLRHANGKPFVRLGIAEGQVKLQTSDSAGIVTQFVGQELKSNVATLKLRITGAHINAFLNGQSLLSRPIEAPANLDRGALALALWRDDSQSLNSTVSLMRVRAKPLATQAAVLPARLTQQAWVQLREKAPQLSVISPPYFSWSATGPKANFTQDTALGIFADYHRLKVLPAVLVSGINLPADRQAFIDRMLAWAGDSGFYGINLVVAETTVKSPEWQQLAQELGKQLKTLDKKLLISVIPDTVWVSAQGPERVLIVSNLTPMSLVESEILYPSSP